MTPDKTSVLQLSTYYDELYYRASCSYLEDIPIYDSLFKDCSASRILDLGGGYGRLALHFTRLGHEVTVIDRSAELLEIGQGLTAREPTEIQDRISWMEADVTEPLQALPLNWFQFALCAHHMINELTDSLDGLFANLGKYLEAGGIAVIHALPAAPYERPRLVEYLNTFPGQDDSEWHVTTAVVPQKQNRDFHRLMFFYEQFLAGRMEQRFMRSIERRVWTPEEIVQVASKYGLAAVEGRSEENFRVFSKLTDDQSRSS